ncbi:hypothetical protein [Roseomonas harenae]|uniref:hypothetical protein n=1 Tax=Muricoccus harenae TaxID=2692566 RepID=UPI0013319335|nr:hypothetical protein [Roseomonas harenae]
MQNTNLVTRFAPAITAHRGGPFLAGDTRSALSLHDDGRLSVVWAPFDHIAAEARLVVVGITPGAQQAENAFQAFRAALQAGMSPAEASRQAKLTGAFSGPMREQLIAMLDHVGAHRLLGVESCAGLFAPGRGLVHLTSALRHPVFVDGANYNGTPDMLRTPALRRMVETHLAEEARALSHALWLPLGPKPAAALQHLARLGLLHPERILGGLPHPSGANRERVNFFLGRKARETLSAKTRPDVIDAARERLCAQIARVPAFG